MEISLLSIFSLSATLDKIAAWSHRCFKSWRFNDMTKPIMKGDSVQALRPNIAPSPDSGSLWTSPISLRFCTGTWWTKPSHSNFKQCWSCFLRVWHWKKFRSLYYQWWVFPQVTSGFPRQICHEVPILAPNLLCCKVRICDRVRATVKRPKWTTSRWLLNS